jgi:ANTAR domain
LIDDFIAHDIAELARLGGGSATRAMHLISELAMRLVGGCSAATMTIWRDGQQEEQTGTHPSVVRLVEAQIALAEGPSIEAFQRGEATVYCPDMLTEARWPQYAAVALRAGVRSTLTKFEAFPESSVTLTLYAVRPRVFDPDSYSLAALLARQGQAVVANLSKYDTAQRTAAQLSESVESRAIVDQAKGMIMQTLGCDEDTAFRRLLAASQRSHVRLVDLATRVVETRGRLPLS